jgi:predicted dehydrogenase
MGVESIISVAVIGSGYMASEHIKAFNSLPNVAVKGLYSRNIEKATKLANELNVPFVSQSIDHLYEMTKAQLVVVAVSETAVPSLIAPLCQFPWTLLMEKPVGLNLQESLMIQEKAKATNTSILVAMNRRFYHATQMVSQALIERAPLKRFIQVQDYQCLETARSFNPPQAVIDNYMYANSIHLVDYFNIFCRGQVKDVQVVQPWNSQRLNPVIAHIQYDSGDEGLYQGIWHGPGPWSVSIVTEDAYYEMRPLEKAFVRTCAERALNALPTSADDTDFKPGLRKQAQHAIQFVQEQENRSTTLAESMRTMQLIHQIYGR